MAGRLTTHVLDTERGSAGGGMRIELARLTPPRFDVALALDQHGRATLLEGADMAAGSYELVFHVAEYYRGRGAILPDPPFLDRVPIRFGIADPDSHYHVPLVVSRFGYTTYRGG